LRVLIAELKLCDFLTFSSTLAFTIIGGISYPVYKPQPYLHNYALLYGFAGILYASLASPKKQVDEIDYRYLEEVEREIYVYPARPRNISVRRLLCNVKSEGYVEPFNWRPKSIYPWHVVHLAFMPGSVFETVILIRNPNIKLPNTIRIGVKRQGVFTVKYYQAEIKGYINGFSDPLNLGDVIKKGYTPSSYVTLLTTRTLRRDVPYSNIIAKGYYTEKKLAVIEYNIDFSNINFRLPIL
jgi:hypothetical protein